jgi:hypothetical protein
VWKAGLVVDFNPSPGSEVMDWLKKAYATVEEEMTQYVSPKPKGKTERKLEDSVVAEERKSDTTSDQCGDGWEDWHAEETGHPGNVATTKQLRNASLASVRATSPSRVEAASTQTANASPKTSSNGPNIASDDQARSSPRPAVTSPPKAKSQVLNRCRNYMVYDDCKAFN